MNVKPIFNPDKTNYSQSELKECLNILNKLLKSKLLNSIVVMAVFVPPLLMLIIIIFYNKQNTLFIAIMILLIFLLYLSCFAFSYLESCTKVLKKILYVRSTIKVPYMSYFTYKDSKTIDKIMEMTLLSNYGKIYEILITTDGYDDIELYYCNSKGYNTISSEDFDCDSIKNFISGDHL